MLVQNFLAWLYWNPPLEAFTIPWIERSVAWYGIFFVSGFIIGYFLFVHILTTYLNKKKVLSLLDIYDWQILVLKLQEMTLSPEDFHSKIFKYFDAKARLKLQAINPTNIDIQTQHWIIEKLNHYFREHDFNRDFLITQLPGIGTSSRTAYHIADCLLWYIVIGTVIGARLGHVLFYDWDFFSRHPIEIFKIWKGGLASHGGVIGVFIGLYLYFQSIKNKLVGFSFLRLLDYVAIPSALAGCFIRLGNFVNQEIVGTPTQLPWAIVFGHAADGSLPIPRHAVQLYEAFAYLIIFIILFALWKSKRFVKQSGFFVGLLFSLLFSARLILEFWKVNQDSIFDNAFLQAGQLLSIPFIFFGLGLIYYSFVKVENTSKDN